MTCLNTMDKKQACSVAMNVLSRLMAVIHYPLVRELVSVILFYCKCFEESMSTTSCTYCNYEQ